MINRSAVLHIPVSQYAFAWDEETVTIRLRAAKNNLKQCSLFWGDRACESSPVTFARAEMKVCWRDESFDFWEITLSSIPKRLCYYFELREEEEWSYYYADQFFRKLPDILLENGLVIEGRSEYYQYPYILQSEICEIPEWFRSAVVYNIFPDSFADSQAHVPGSGFEITDERGNRHISRLGGTLRGITENLEYIKELGFNCIYLNPIFSAGEYHKYDTIDYYHVDPTLGTDADFRELTEKLHGMGMHIIIDGVFNHCGWRNPFFRDILEKGEASAYRNWFYGLPCPVELPREGKKPSYACFAYEKKMPKLNTAASEVQEYFAGIGRYWIEEFHVDGWRLDVANEVDKNFWRTFKRSVRRANPEAVLIGEVWENAKDWLHCDMMDSTMNYDFRKHCRELFAQGNYTAADFKNAMTDMLLRYPTQLTQAQLNLLDSHDVPRFLSLCGGEIRKWKPAFLCLAFFPGIPSVFYGDERGICGIREEEYRSSMDWSAGNEELRRFVRDVLKIRRELVVPEALWSVAETKEEEELFIFERRNGESAVRVILHTGEKDVNISAYMQNGRVLLQSGENGEHLSAWGYMILKIRTKADRNPGAHKTVKTKFVEQI